MTNPPNILLITTDQQHWRSLGCTGCGEARTPHLDALRRQGILYRNHCVANQVCMPSRASLFTGLPINRHGVWANGCRLSRSIPTIPDLLGAAGWQTAHVGKLHLEPIMNRIGRSESYGFQHAEVAEGDQQLTHDADAHFAWMRTHRPDLFLMVINEMYQNGHDCGYRSKLPAEAHLNSFIADRAIAWLDGKRQAGKPFFLNLGFFDPHHAFNPSEPYWSRFAEVEVEEPHFREGAVERRPAHYGKWFDGRRKVTRDAERIRGIRRAFHAMMAHVDDSVGRVLAHLGKLGLERDTVVVFTSDHGEMLGNHGFLHKGPWFFDDLLRVPLIVARPDGVERNQTCETPTSGCDLFATLACIAGVAAPDQGTLPFADRELKPCPRGGREFTLTEWEDDGQVGQGRCVRTAGAKLVRFASGEGEFYDLARDPLEFENRFGDPAVAAEQRRLEAMLASCYPGQRAPTRQECQW